MDYFDLKWKIKGTRQVVYYNGEPYTGYAKLYSGRGKKKELYAEGNCVNGQWEGEWVECGKIKGAYLNGFKVGRHLTYYDSGAVECDEFYLPGGVPDGEHKHFYEDGALRKISRFINGEPVESFRYWKNGNLQYSIVYLKKLKKNNYEVDEKYYDESGRLQQRLG